MKIVGKAELHKDLLQKDPWNVRESNLLNTSTYKDLVDSIRIGGLSEHKPLYVRKNGGEKYGIIDGWQRFSAGDENGHDKFYVIIVEANDIEAAMMSIRENETQTKLTIWEKINAVKRIVEENKGIIPSFEGTGLGGPQTVKKYLAISKLPLSIRTFLLEPPQRELKVAGINRRLRDVIEKNLGERNMRTKKIPVDLMYEIAKIHRKAIQFTKRSVEGVNCEEWAEKRVFNIVAFIINRHRGDVSIQHYLTIQKSRLWENIFDIFKDCEEIKRKENEKCFPLWFKLPSEYREKFKTVLRKENKSRDEMMIILTEILELVIRNPEIFDSLKRLLLKPTL